MTCCDYCEYGKSDSFFPCGGCEDGDMFVPDSKLTEKARLKKELSEKEDEVIEYSKKLIDAEAELIYRIAENHALRQENEKLKEQLNYFLAEHDELVGYVIAMADAVGYQGKDEF